MLTDHSYSAIEKDMIKNLSQHWAGVITKSTIHLLDLYKILALESFMKKREDVYTELLREAIAMIDSSTIFTLQEYHDALYHLKDKL